MKRGLVIFIIVLIVIVLLGIVLMSLFKSKESVKSKESGEEPQLGPAATRGGAGGPVKGDATVFDGRIMKVTEIFNGTSGITNDKIVFTDFETGENYRADIVAEGIGTVSVKGLSYNVKYFGSSTSSSEDRFVIVSSFDGSREQKVFYNAYVLFFAKGVGPVPTVYCGNGIKDRGEQCDDGNKVSGDGCSSTCLNDSISKGSGRIMKVTEIFNGTSGITNDKIVFTDFETGENYRADIVAEGIGTVSVKGLSYNVKYFGSSTSSSEDRFVIVSSGSISNEEAKIAGDEQKAFLLSYVIIGKPSFDGRIMKVTQITNSSSGISNDRVKFTDLETKEVYNAILTSEGRGTVSVKGLSYNVKYFGRSTSSSEDRFVIVSSFDGSREQRVSYNAYALFFAKGK